MLNEVNKDKKKFLTRFIRIEHTLLYFRSMNYSEPQHNGITCLNPFK